MDRKKLIGFVALIITSIFGGGLLPFLIRMGTTNTHPFIFNFLRSGISLIIALPFFIKKKSLSDLWRKENHQLILILGLGLGLNVTLFSLGVNYTTLVASQLIYVLVPVLSSFISFLLNNERINRAQAFGMVLAMAGVLLLILLSQSPEQRQSLGSFLGNALIFGGMLGYSSYLAFSKKFTQRKSVLEMSTLTQLALTIFLIPLAIFGLIQGGGFDQIGSTSLLIGFLTAIASFSFLVLVQVTIKNLSTSTASLASILNPEFAAISGVLLYQEKINWWLIVSLVMGISGAIISIRAENNN